MLTFATAASPATSMPTMVAVAAAGITPAWRRASILDNHSAEANSETAPSSMAISLVF